MSPSHRARDDDAHVSSFFRHLLDVAPHAERPLSVRRALAHVVEARERVDPASPRPARRAGGDPACERRRTALPSWPLPR